MALNNNIESIIVPLEGLTNNQFGVEYIKEVRESNKHMGYV